MIYYHYTHVIRLPFIFQAGEISLSRPMKRRERGILWATAACDGEATAGVVNARFRIDGARVKFRPWEKAAKAAGINRHERLKLARIGEDVSSSVHLWVARLEPITLDRTDLLEVLVDGVWQSPTKLEWDYQKNAEPGEWADKGMTDGERGFIDVDGRSWLVTRQRAGLGEWKYTGDKFTKRDSVVDVEDVQCVGNVLQPDGG